MSGVTPFTSRHGSSSTTLPPMIWPARASSDNDPGDLAEAQTARLWPAGRRGDAGIQAIGVDRDEHVAA
jgi:hypothetical protein